MLLRPVVLASVLLATPFVVHFTFLALEAAFRAARLQWRQWRRSDECAQRRPHRQIDAAKSLAEMLGVEQ